MIGHIFISTESSEQPLEEFARRLFSRLGVAQFEERESSNDVDEHYFRGCSAGIEVTVALADTRSLEGYRFWVTLEPELSGGLDGHYLHDHAYTLAQLFSRHGWRCFVPDDFTTVGGEHEGKVYTA